MIIEDRDGAWLCGCPGLTLEHWQEERRLVEERFSLPFAEAAFFGFRGVVARSGAQYSVTVTAEMDFYPSTNLGFLSGRHLGEREDGKLGVNLPWQAETSTFADVVGAVIAQVEVVH